ncbi:MAG: DNA-protecting protein DprA, partial [Deltaproteobacteria bacterium]
MDEKFYWLALKLVPGVGAKTFLRLLERFGEPEKVFRAKRESLAQVKGITKKAVDNIVLKKFEKDPEKELEDTSRKGIKIICLKDSEYPKNLAQIHDPPPVLFVKGDLSVRDVVSVAVVGSRSASYQGLRFTKKLCADLAGYGIVVVSGFARGIDTAAHTGCIEGGGRTLAVLGCGLDIDYPRQNRELREKVVRNGALITEFPLGTEPESKNFPARNRIISGLSLGVIVVEAGKRSGSLITARLALEQNREVFAVPGSVRSYRSLGPNWLIKQGAKLVERAEDVVEELAPMLGVSLHEKTQQEEKSEPAASGSFSEDETKVLDLLNDEPMLLDDMVRILDMEVNVLAGILSKLELKGHVKQLPGKFF